MKVKKTGVIVPIVLALVFLIAGLVVLFLPTSKPPVEVSEEISFHRSGGYYFFDGKIKNVSDKQVRITYLEITLSTSGPDTSNYDNTLYALKPDEELDLGDFYYNGSYTPYRVTQVKVTVDGKSYYLYERLSFKTVGAIFLFVIAAIFGIAAASTAVQASRRQKRYNSIEETLGKMENNAVFMLGTYGKAGDAGKAAAKTAVSVLGGVVSAIFLGAGAYKIYGVNNLNEFVLTDDGLYAGRPTKGKDINLANMMFINKDCFKDFAVSTKKNQVVMNHKINGDTISLNFAESKTLTAETVAQRINAMAVATEAANTEAAPAEAPSEAPAPEDPFAEV